MSFPFEAKSVEVVSIDSTGNAIDIVLNGRNRFYIGRIRKQSYSGLANVFYHRNQEYVLGTLSTLIVGLIAMAFFRWKAKRELEITRLKQNVIIADEKYKQAKAIAGGFAHEIRNALCPADVILTQIRRACKSDLMNINQVREFQRDTHAAISRAIGITELISIYTKLDSEYRPEDTDLLHPLPELVSRI